MRILHLSKFYPPDPGGLEHVVATLAEGAAAAGHHVRVVCAQGAHWKGQATQAPNRMVRHSVQIVRAPTYGIGWSQPLAPTYPFAARWICDVVYVHRPHPLADLTAALMARGKTIIFHHSDVQRQRAARMAYRPLARWVASRARAVVVATQSHLAQAEDLGPGGRARARVIPYGVDTARFVPGVPDDRPAPFESLGSGPVGFFVGRLVGYKGLDVLLRAVAGTDLSVVIAGDGPVRASLARQVADLGLGGRVALVGGIPDADLTRYHQAADYFVLPSNTPAEMFGIAMVEAMACGKPVVSTSLPTGVREVNVDGVTGLQVAPNDHEALRAAMERLSGDGALRAKMGDAGRARVEELYSLDGMIAEHMGLCEELTGRREKGEGRRPAQLHPR